jgi:hypothetical protein
MTERKRPYYVCDGCGYVIDEGSQHGMLILSFKRRYAVAADPAVKHFHGPREMHELKDKEGKAMIQDCLTYWWTNRRARQLAEGDDWK